MSSRKSETLFIGATLAALALIQSIHLTRPFLRHHESVGTEVGKHARNHLKFGLSKTFGLKLDVSGPSLVPYEDYRRYFYSNHPPLPVLIMAGSFVMFGVSEATYRVTLILFSAVAVLLFRRIAARLVPAPHDRTATVIFAALPMFAYYSIVTCLQVTALVGILAGVLFYLRWRDDGGTGPYLGILISTGLACYCAWPGYYLAPALAAAHLRSGQPRTRAVLALLGWNVVVFGLYLFHLWIASPPDLDPIRKLLSAGTDRASLQGIRLLPYMLGECRELALMITVPVIGLAAVGLIPMFRKGVSRDHRLVASIAILGMDEIVFARLASQHEYYSYFLVVFFALAAGIGLGVLSSWIRARQPAAALPVVSVVLGLALLQSVWILQRRLTHEGGYEFYYRLGLALKEGVRPNQRVLLLTDSTPFYTPYYGDVYQQWYNASDQELRTENSGGRRYGVREQDLEEIMSARPCLFDVAVTAEKATVVPYVAFLQRLDDAQLRKFGVETERTSRRAVLERRCGLPVECGGFLFWKLQ
jgi:hypothetical protein